MHKIFVHVDEYFTTNYVKTYTTEEFLIAAVNGEVTEVDEINLSGVDNDLFLMATMKGLYVRSLIVNEHTRDHHLEYCNRLQSLDCSPEYKSTEKAYIGITTCKPFAATLKKLYAHGPCGITNESLADCISLELLDVSFNPNVKSCNHVGSMLFTLIAAGNSCGISNDSLQQCRQLIRININGNTKVTNFSPFAKTIVEVIANYTNITDETLKHCHKIEELENVAGFVTTCAPFAHSITVLDVSSSKYFYPSSLANCSRLQTLFINNNPNIDDCNMLCKTLTMLYAGGKECALTPKGISKCTCLKILDVHENPNSLTPIPSPLYKLSNVASLSSQYNSLSSENSSFYTPLLYDIPLNV